MIIALCALVLLPHRPSHMIGKEVTRFDIYRTDRTEHCFEEIRKLGHTWFDDETISLIEVSMENCQ